MVQAMITSTVENYLKSLFMLNAQGDNRITTGELAKSLNVTPGSATSMIKTLAEDGIKNLEEYLIDPSLFLLHAGTAHILDLFFNIIQSFPILTNSPPL